MIRPLKTAASITICALGLAAVIAVLAAHGEPTSSALVSFLVTD